MKIEPPGLSVCLRRQYMQQGSILIHLIKVTTGGNILSDIQPLAFRRIKYQVNKVISNKIQELFRVSISLISK